MSDHAERIAGLILEFTRADRAADFSSDAVSQTEVLRQRGELVRALRSALPAPAQPEPPETVRVVKAEPGHDCDVCSAPATWHWLDGDDGNAFFCLQHAAPDLEPQPPTPAPSVPDEGREPTIRRHVDGGYVWTLCPDCGPDCKVDEDGCCQSCGRDATHFGREAAALNREGGGGEAEPVAWRYRDPEPLYAAPPPSPASEPGGTDLGEAVEASVFLLERIEGRAGGSFKQQVAAILAILRAALDRKAGGEG